MSLVDTIFGDCIKFEDKRERDLRFVEFMPKASLIRAWWIKEDMGQQCDSILLGLDPREVGQEALEFLGIWDKLSDSMRFDIENGDTLIKKQIQERMAEMREKRKGKEEYADLPRMITCCNSGCDSSVYIAPSILEKKAGLRGLEGDARAKALKAFLDTYECSECKPVRRGKAPNPLYKNIPRKVKCSDCDKECTINVKNLYEQTGGDKAKIKKYCDEYLCRSCNPDWGSWLRGKNRKGRKAKPENEGFPKEATCTNPDCGKVVKIVPDNIRKKAALMGITVEDLLANYKCRSCGGVIRGAKRKKRKLKKK